MGGGISIKAPSSLEISNRYDSRIQSCQNPLFAQWIKEWYQQACADSFGKLHFVYRKALESMVAHPHPISDPKDTAKLNGIGESIRKKLESKYQNYIENGGTPLGPLSQKSIVVKKKKKSASTTKPYLPTFKSGAYSILIALFINMRRQKDYCLRSDLVALAQPYCNVPLEEGIFSAFNGAIKTLVSKELLVKSGNPARYFLTEEGIILAQRLFGTLNDDNNTILSSSSLKVSIPPQSHDETFFSWPKDSFTIILLIDTREIKSRDDREFFSNNLQDLGITCESRSLELGDFLWIARQPSCPDEIVLDYIVERKREDDLLASIPDGRFVEQKFRLRSCGLSNIIYLVEKKSGIDFGAIGEDRFKAAIVNTQAIDDFYLRYTCSLKETVRFLADMTMTIKKNYTNSSLKCLRYDIPFDKSTFIKEKQNRLMTFGCFTFVNSKSSSMTIHNLFLKQLLVIRQMTGEKASLILTQYPTPIQYEKNDD